MDRYDPDELLVCPYDPVHRVARKRFQGHLVKCRKNYNTKNFAVCPFNAKHVVHKPELSYHISTCEDRGRLELEIHHTSSAYKAKGNTSIPVNNWRPPSPIESWDDDNVKYVPKEVAELYNEEEMAEPQSHSTIEQPNQHVHSNPVVRLPNKTDSQSLVFNYSLERGGRGRGRGILTQDPITIPPLAIGRSKGILGLGQPGLPLIPSGLHLQNESITIDRPVVKNNSSPVVKKDPLHVQSHADHMTTTQDEPKPISEDETVVMLKKRVRKLNKMLKQIEQIEMKQAQGSILDGNQLAKLNKKKDALESLQKAEEDLHNAEITSAKS